MKFGQVDDLNSVSFEWPSITPQTKKILSNYQSKKKPIIHLGGPGWSDKNYKGTLYPNKTPQNKFLSAYAKQFNSIEVNATRYGTPKIHVLNNWVSQVPNDFKFSLKVPQVITHRKNINDYESRIRMEKFIEAIFHLGNHSGISFAVMANYFKSEQMEELIDFIDFWPKDTRLAIELRHPSWYEGNIVAKWQSLFAKNNIIPVLTDTPGRRDVAHFALSNEHLFVRYVGDFSHPTDKKRINCWLDRIEALIQFGIQNIWFYVHQPSDNRECIIDFFNHLTPKLNDRLSLDIPELINYK